MDPELLELINAIEYKNRLKEQIEYTDAEAVSKYMDAEKRVLDIKLRISESLAS